MNARDIWILYLHEIRSALRERSVVVYSLLIPAVLYPALVWLAWTGATFVAGQTSDLASRIALVDVPAAHAAFVDDLKAEKAIEVIQPAPGSERPGPEAIRAGDVDAILEWSPIPSGAGAEGGADNFTVHVLFDGSKPRSEGAADRLTEAARAYRDKWLTGEARRRGVDLSTWAEARFASRSVASGRDMGAFLLKLVIPILLLVMISVGCFYPAIDATAGERERSTWETLMTVGASRSSIVLAKYLYVATFGAAAGMLNLGAMVLSLKAILASAVGQRAGSTRLVVPLSAIPLTILCAVLIALFIAAAMMILASLARTFKEGQAMITPFYLAIIVPALLLQSPDIELTPALASIPLVNVALTFREAISGTVRWPLVALTAATQLAAIGACLFIAARLTRFEEMVAGPSQGGPGKLLLAWLRRRAPAAKKGAR